MKNKLFIFIYFLSFIDVHCSAISKIKDDKLAYSTIYTDESNKLWIASEYGVFQWTNSTTQKIGFTPGIQVTAIHSTGGILILGTNDGKIYTYDRNIKKLSLLGDMKTRISDIQVKGGILCIASHGSGYVTVSPYEIRWFTTRNGLTDNFIYTIQIEEDGSIWSSTDQGMNCMLPDHTIDVNFFNQRIPDKLITCFEKKNDILFCGTQLGDVCKINLADSSISIFDHTIWNGAQINDLRVLDRSLVIATNHGAYLIDFDGNLIETIIHNQLMKHIEVDQEANLWLSGERILVWSSGEQLSLLKTIDETRIRNVHAMHVSNKNTLYFTPDQGLVKYDLINKIKKEIFVKHLSPNIDITAMSQDKLGRLWIGTSGMGIFLVDTATFAIRPITIDSSGETTNILSIAAGSDKIWVTSLNGVWYCDANSFPYVFKPLEDEFGKKKYYAYQVKKDRKDNLWLATDGKGMIKLSKGSFNYFTVEKKIDPTVFTSVEEDESGQLWFNAYNDGLYCLRGDSLIHITKRNGLSSEDILSLISYQKNYIVATSSVGIDLINIHNLIVYKYIFESLHIPQIPENNSISTTNKDVYIGTTAGLLKLYVPSYKTLFMPQAKIVEIAVMERNNPREKTKFSSDENYFKFWISSNFNTDQTIYYRYKLKGLNDIWNNTVGLDFVFPRLNPGSYELIIEASTNSSFNNATSDTFSFTISQPLWRQNWFIFLVMSVFALSFYYYVRFREGRISRLEQLEKEKVIAEFETLKHQVSPHFLFNSFNTLIQIIDEDKELAIEYTQMLSDYYRSLISYRNVDLVTFDEELILLDKYMYLQKMRFGDSLSLNNKCTANQIEGVEIPPLTLQLLAENAIKHNTISSARPLTIEVKMNSNFIIISNNLNEKLSKEQGEGIGLQNIRKRFKQFSKKEVFIHKTTDEFEVILPILKP